MAWTVTWAVRCEGCTATGPQKPTSEAAEKSAVGKGWLKGQCHGMALHLCPACVSLGLPDWWPDATGLAFHWE
jgi:hypothetical protein